MSICNKDCFHCIYEDCINDDMDHEDYIAAAARDKELRSSAKSKKLAAQKKAYREANREKLAAQKKILEIRKQLGLTQKEAAKILGISQSSISYLEKGCIPCDLNAVITRLQEGLV